MEDTLYEHQRLNYPRQFPWIMKQTWLDTLFIHYPVKKEVLSKLVPQTLPIDTFDNMGWVSIVPYLTTSVRGRGLPSFPGVNQFAGFNIRTYVKLNGKPGVYFFRLAASSWLNATMAKVFFKLPYTFVNMKFNNKGDFINFESDSLESREGKLDWIYRPISEQRLAKKGSLEEWLVERYCLYTVNENGQPMRSDILHHSWLLQDAEAELHQGSLLSDIGISTLDTSPLFHYSKKVDVKIWPIRPC